MTFSFKPTRYELMIYRRCGRSGLQLPVLSLGLWQNFGGTRDFRRPSRSSLCLRRRHHPFRSRQQLRSAAGLPPKSSSGACLARELPALSRRADHLLQGGLRMWPGPYGDFGSRKYLDRQRRPEPQAHGPRLSRHLLFPPLRPDYAAGGDDGRARHIVRQGKALYVGISSYPRSRHAQATRFSRIWACRCSSISRAIRCSTAGSKRTTRSTRAASSGSA